MMAELRLAKLELLSDGVAHETVKPRQRSLGGAILLVAIDDYRSRNAEIHETAKQFLYPTSSDWQDHFDWAASLVEGLNRAWLREALDRSRLEWDMERAGRLARTRCGKKLRRRRSANERKTGVERVQAAVVVRGDRVAV